jgi:hypothetical protein
MIQFNDNHPAKRQGDSMQEKTVRRVAVVGGNRIPFARSNSAYAHASNQDMLTAALNGLIERCNLKGKRLGEVVGGAVMKHSRDFNLVRESVMSTALAPETPLLRSSASVWHGAGSRDPGGQQNSIGANRVRDCLRSRYDFRCADWCE